MAKKELHRKIIATVLTALALGAALALCIVLLVSSPVFSGALRITMLVCTVALAVAIVGLVVCKVQEIRTLAEIVRLDKQAPHRAAPAQGDEADTPAPRADRAAPHPAAAPDADEADADLEMQQPSLTVSMPAPEPAAAPAQQHNWKPLNFSSFHQQTPSGRSRGEAERAVQQAAQTAQQQAERAAQRGAAEAEAERQRQLAAQQAAYAAQRGAAAAEAERQRQLAAQQAAYAAQQQAAQLEAQRRAEQIRLAQAARTGGAAAESDEAHLAALARAAEQARLAQAQQRPAAQPAAEAQMWVNAQAAPAAPAVEVPAVETPAAPQPAAEPAEAAEPAHKLNVKPIQWPAPPPPSKIFVTSTSQVPVITDEMLAAHKAQQQAQKAAEAWKKSE